MVANTENDQINIGFAIGFGCLLGAPKNEVIMSICELLLSKGYKQQYDIMKCLLEDINFWLQSDALVKYANFLSKIRAINAKCNLHFSKLIRHFTDLDINKNTFKTFIASRSNCRRLVDLIVCANECLVLFEELIQFPFAFSNICTQLSSDIYNITKNEFDLFMPMLYLLLLDYKYIPSPIKLKYNDVTIGLQIELPDDIEPRKLSYNLLVKRLELIKPYQRRHLTVTLCNVNFNDKHYDYIINLNNILRDMNVIRELNVEFALTNISLNLSSKQQYFRQLIIAKILSITSARDMNFPNLAWCRVRLDGYARDIKLEENALYARMLPIFDSVTSSRQNSKKQVKFQKQSSLCKI